MTTIAEMRERSKARLAGVPADLLLVGVLLLTASASFGLGILVGRDVGGQGSGFSIEEAPASAPSVLGASAASTPAPVTVSAPKPAPANPSLALPLAGNYVASKNGTRYYLPTCSGVKQIKEANKVWFLTKEAAEAAGYTPALNCPGLQNP